MSAHAHARLHSDLTRIAVDGLASYRIARLVTEDKLTEPIRERIYARFGQPHPDMPPNLSYLTSCPHCVAVWANLLLVAGHRILPRTTRAISSALAAAALASIVKDTQDQLDSLSADGF